MAKHLPSLSLTKREMFSARIPRRVSQTNTLQAETPYKITA